MSAISVKSKSTNQISNDNISSDIIKNEDLSSNLLEKYNNLNLSIESVGSLSSFDRRDSAQSSNSIQTDSSLGDNNSQTFTSLFNSKLKSYGKNVFIIDSIQQLVELLDFYYSDSLNPIDHQNYFPYLHGLTSDRQRIFFNDKFRNADNDNFNIDDFEHLNSFTLPETLHFNLMTINTDNHILDHANGAYKLVNSVSYEDIKGFDTVNDLTSINDLNNRNFKDQLKLMANLSHFLIYDHHCNLNNNLNIAMNLKNHTSKNIYVVNFSKLNWEYVPAYYIDDYNYRLIDNLPINSINNREFNCKLLKWEQNYIWKHNSMTWLNKNICLGNLIDFNYLANSDHDFKLIINCNEFASIPAIFNMYIEFPSSGYLNFEALSSKELLNFLNLLKHIKDLMENGEKIFIFSFDGFTGLSLLTIAISLILDIQLSLQDVILKSYRDDMKLYFFKQDLIFLKKFEGFMKNDICNEKRYRFRSLESLNMTSRHYSWFNFAKDNNFPCNIYKTLFLGSINHANSPDILNCLKFNKIVSIGEKPDWLKVNDAPIYSFYNKQNDKVEVYDIKIHKKEFPHLKSVIFIKNLKDDGKDSILPLLINCPPHIQSKILHNPNQNCRTLYHCRIGVSRSASLVIASLMKFQKMSLMESYMIVRINRFNIIIQPNLKLFFELYIYENYLNRIGGNTRRNHCWWVMCNEIYKLNRNYID